MSENSFYITSVIVKETGESGYVLDSRMFNGKKQLLLSVKEQYSGDTREEWIGVNHLRIFKEEVTCYG